MQSYEVAQHNEKMRLAAVQWLCRHASVFPVAFRSKQPLAGLLPSDENGNPVWEPYKHRYPTFGEISKWTRQRYPINLAVICGRGLVVVDFDLMDAFYKWYQDREVMTYMVMTSRGIHCYFRVKQLVTGSTFGYGRFDKAGDIKRDGGYVLAPGSVHQSGQTYQAINPDCPIREIYNLDEIGIFPKVVVQDPTWQPAKPVTLNPAHGCVDIWTSAELSPSDVCREIKTRLPILQLIPGKHKREACGTVSVHCVFPENHKNSDQKHTAFVNERYQVYHCKCLEDQGVKPMDVINLYEAQNKLGKGQGIGPLRKNLGI